MPILYKPGLQYQAGVTYSVTDPSDARDPTKTVAVPLVATVSVGATGVPNPAGTQADPAYTQTATLPAGTDRSNTATTTSQALIAANANRRGLNIQNIGANNIGVNETGGAAAIGTPGTYTLIPNAFLNVRTNRAVSFIAATGSTAFSATEF